MRVGRPGWINITTKPERDNVKCLERASEVAGGRHPGKPHGESRFSESFSAPMPAMEQAPVHWSKMSVEVQRCIGNPRPNESLAAQGELGPIRSNDR